MKKNPDFKHWLWTNDKGLLSAHTINALEAEGVEIKEVNKDLDSSQMRNLVPYEQALREGRFAEASDILRLEAVFQRGGFIKTQIMKCFRLSGCYTKFITLIPQLNPGVLS